MKYRHQNSCPHRILKVCFGPPLYLYWLLSQPSSYTSYLVYSYQPHIIDEFTEVQLIARNSYQLKLFINSVANYSTQLQFVTKPELHLLIAYCHLCRPYGAYYYYVLTSAVYSCISFQYQQKGQWVMNDRDENKLLSYVAR